MSEHDVQHAYLETLAVDAWSERWLLDLAEDLHRRIERGKAWQEQQRQRKCSNYTARVTPSNAV